MYKNFILSLMALGLVASVYAADLSKEEKKQIKDQLKTYKKDPAKFKSMIDKYKETIDSNTADLARKKDAIDQLNKTNTEIAKKASALDELLRECTNKPVPKCPDPMADVLTIPEKGTVYKVQLGLYRKFDMNSYFAKPKYVGFEKADGLNRYIVSYFENKEEAEHFASDLRKLGLHDAFVSRYSDGQRIYEKNPKKKSHKTTLKAK